MMAGMRCLVWLLLVLGLACGVGDGRAAVGTFLGGTSVQEFATTVTPASDGWRYAGYDRYAAYGTRVQEASAGGAPADRFRANSKEEDPTGLLNEGFRYRDLETGTFIGRDPLGFVDGLNVYCYVGQNPWSAFDPEGLAVPRDRDQAQRHRDAILGAYDTAHEYMGRAIEVMSQGMRDGSGRTGEAWFEKAEFFSQAARYMSVELEVYERYRDAHGNCSDGVPNWWDPGCLGECTPEQIADTTYQARQTGAIGDSAIIQPTSLMKTDMTFKFLDAGLTVSGVGAGVKALSAVSRKLFAGIGKAAVKGVMVGGAYESRGGLLWMGADDTKTATIGLGKGGHFGCAVEAGMTGIRPETHRGLTMFQREGWVFWANDSLSLSKAVTQSESAAIQKAQEAQFKDHTVKQVQQIGDVFK
jgi:RHS repeat-associated protein